MSLAKPIITIASVEAYAASALRMLGWLLNVILRLNLQGRSVRLAHMLSRAEHAVECILFLKAVTLYGPPPRRSRHQRSTPPGFRRAKSNHRLFFKGAAIRAGKAAGALSRVIYLIDAIARPERAVAHFLKQLRQGLTLSRIVPSAPPPQGEASDAAVTAFLLVDTS